MSATYCDVPVMRRGSSLRLTRAPRSLDAMIGSSSLDVVDEEALRALERRRVLQWLIHDTADVGRTPASAGGARDAPPAEDQALEKRQDEQGLVAGHVHRGEPGGQGTPEDDRRHPDRDVDHGEAEGRSERFDRVKERTAEAARRQS